MPTDKEVGIRRIPAYTLHYTTDCNTIQTFPHASITEFTKCPIISLPYHHYIEKKNVQKSFEDIAEHLFNHCKSKFLAEVNLSSRFLVFI